MIVDPLLLRCGADFSHSAGEIVQRGADDFASTPVPAGIFGDFDAADTFQQALSRAHDACTTTMQQHRTQFDGLAENATSAAAIFVNEDEASASALDSTGRNFT
ncbi:DUF2563 family protein [Mycolicibacterium thermoresistibile]